MKRSTPTFDDREARQLVADGDLDAAMRLVHEGLRDSICIWLRRLFPSLTVEDLSDVWAATLFGVMKSIQSGRYDVSRSLVGWVCRIAHNQATDCVRRARTRKQLHLLASQLFQRSRSANDWATLDEAERVEAMAFIRDAIATLPTKQRIVLQVFLDHFPESRHLDVLQREVSRVTGEHETMASIKRALQEGRLKVRLYLRKRGYAPEAGNDDA